LTDAKAGCCGVLHTITPPRILASLGNYLLLYQQGSSLLKKGE
jgi:hypothetical protein